MAFLSKLFAKPVVAAERVLFVDIGSSSVSAALAEISHGKPHVVGLVDVPIEVGDHVSFEKLEARMYTALRLCMHRARQSHFPTPERIQVALASPWYASQVRKAKLTRPKEFIVSKTILDDMVSREVQAFEAEEINEKKGTHTALRCIESRTLDVRLNGYPVHAPIGQTVLELELSLFIAVAHERIAAEVQNIVEHAYPVRNVTLGTFLATAYYVSRTFIPHEDNFLLVDIGGDVTDVSLVRDGTLVQSVSFPKGSRTVLRSLAKTLGRSLDEAAILWKLSMECKTGGPVGAACDQILTNARKDWMQAFLAAVRAFPNAGSARGTLVLSVDADAKEWFTSVIGHADFHPHSESGSGFAIIVLDAALLHGSVVFGPNVPRDPSLMIEIIGAGYLKRAQSMVQ